MAIIERAFDKYEVTYGSKKDGQMMASIRCSAGATLVAILGFSPQVVLPNTIVGDDILVVRYALDGFPAVLDILRNERPLVVAFDDNDSRAWVGTAGSEPVGEGET